MKTKKMEYEAPEMEISAFTSDDVVLISANLNSEDTAYKLKEFDWNDTDW